MSKRSHDSFASDYDFQFNFGQDKECECNLCLQADNKEASDPHLSKFDLLPFAPLRKHICLGLPSKMGLEDHKHEYDPTYHKILFYQLKDYGREVYDGDEEFRKDLEETLCKHLCGSEIHHVDEEYDLSSQYGDEDDLSYEHSEEYDNSCDYDEDYDASYNYYEEEAEEEQEMPDFECQEDMHRWMLAHAEDTHRTSTFKDVTNQYPVWMGCDKAEKDLDGGVMRAMMMAENLGENAEKCDEHDVEEF